MFRVIKSLYVFSVGSDSAQTDQRSGASLHRKLRQAKGHNDLCVSPSCFTVRAKECAGGCESVRCRDEGCGAGSQWNLMWIEWVTRAQTFTEVRVGFVLWISSIRDDLQLSVKIKQYHSKSVICIWRFWFCTWWMNVTLHCCSEHL